MISLSQLRKNLFQIFKLLKEQGFEVEIYHDNQAYKLYAVPIDKPVKARYRPRKKTATSLDFGNCLVCGEVLANGVCMNATCPGSER